jgi:hypothetical protein
MKFSVLAIDFDGTAARGDVLDPEVRAAIGELRAQGIVVILATGRILEDLRRVAGDLHFVDAVVAENGAVVLFPDSGHSTVNGEPPQDNLLAVLGQEGIRIDVGRVVVEADATEAPRILAVVRRLELPLGIAFNRGRLMVLPQTISKATGVRQASRFRSRARECDSAKHNRELRPDAEAARQVLTRAPAASASGTCTLPAERGTNPHAAPRQDRPDRNARLVRTEHRLHPWDERADGEPNASPERCRDDRNAIRVLPARRRRKGKRGKECSANKRALAEGMAAHRDRADG